MEEQHVYHHQDTVEARINVKIERNSRGYNFEATVTNAKSVDEAMAIIKDAETKLRREYGADETK